MSSVIHLKMIQNEGRIGYYFDETLTGWDEQGFNEFLDILENAKEAYELIIYKDFGSESGGKKQEDTYPFSSYRRGYVQLESLCKQKEIVLIHGGFA